MRVLLRGVGLAVLIARGLPGQATPPPSYNDLLARSPATDWVRLDPENTLYLDLPQGRVIILLAPRYAPLHVANIKKLARAKYFDGAAIVRVQDNYVVQWAWPENTGPALPEAKGPLAPEFARPISPDLPFTPLPDPDTYAPEVGFSGGFPVARNRSLGLTWLAHCYGMVGAGREDAPDSGPGSELYAVIGQAPRHLDRNVALVGRVVQGIELLSSLPRGTGNLGFYTQPSQRTPIHSIRVAADLPERDRVPLEMLRTESATFRAVIASRRTRRESWFVEPTGRINVCNVPLPVRTPAP
jgi:peptidylprolyl isomerase